MPWTKVEPMDQKLLFIADYLRKVHTFTALCLKYGISRKTGYKWVYRYRSDGPSALHDLSTKPKHIPHKTPYAVRKEIIKLRTSFREPLGAKKIQALLQKKCPGWHIPSLTTIHTILKEQGYVSKRRKRLRVPPMQKPLQSTKVPNVLWTVDYKGQFKTQDGTWCYPLTIMDYSTRYLLSCRGVSGTTYKEAKKVFTHVFTQYGLPQRIRTDNGVPFASSSAGGLSRLSAWWVRLGILPERIKPGCPQQNGRHERMHRTLKKVTANPPAKNKTRQQGRFDLFVQEYNELRPHESLGQETPASKYTKSTRRMPGKIKAVEYPLHYKVCLINPNGVVYVNGKRVYVNCLLPGEHIGLEEVGEGEWLAYYGPVLLGRVDESKAQGNKKDYIPLEKV